MKKGKFQKYIIYIVILFAAISVWSITDNLFLQANNKKTDSNFEILSVGSIDSENIFPDIIKNFEMNLQYENGNEQLRHYELKGKAENSNIYGYVQIWKSENSLKHYLDISKKYMSKNVYGFYETDITIDNVKWRKWDYIVNFIAVSQGFIEKDGKIYFCSLCVPYKEKTYSFDKLFIELLQNII